MFARIGVMRALNRRVAQSEFFIILSAGPGTHPIAEFVIDLPRPAVFAGVLVLTVFALLLDTTVTLVERRMIVGRPT